MSYFTLPKASSVQWKKPHDEAQDEATMKGSSLIFAFSDMFVAYFRIHHIFGYFISVRRFLEIIIQSIFCHRGIFFLTNAIKFNMWSCFVFVFTFDAQSLLALFSIATLLLTLSNRGNMQLQQTAGKTYMPTFSHYVSTLHLQWASSSLINMYIKTRPAGYNSMDGL